MSCTAGLACCSSTPGYTATKWPPSRTTCPKIHLTGLEAIEEPPSLVDLRARTTAMLPRVELPEVILEVMSWAPELAEAFTAVSGGRSRLDDLPTSIAACLAAHSMNIGYRPIAKKGIPALERARLSHVFRNYVRPETLAAANAPLVARQAGLSELGYRHWPY